MINVGAMVRACAAMKGPIELVAEHERNAAWQFVASARAGKFRVRGRLGILYLPEFVSGDGSVSRWGWLSVEELGIAETEGGPARWWPPLAFLDRCWVGRTLAGAWEQAHGYAAVAVASVPHADLGEDWFPDPDVKTEFWARSPAAEAEARRRAGANASDRTIGEQLAEMWRGARRRAVQASTFERYRRKR